MEKKTEKENSNVRVDYTSGENSIKKRVWTLFRQNPMITAKEVCSALHLSYSEKGQLINNYLSEFRYNLRFGNIPSLPHDLPHWRKWVWKGVVFSEEAQDRALSCGWRLSGNRNGALVFRDGLGSVEWFQNGSVLVSVRGSSNLGMAKTLFCKAFSWLSDSELSRLCEGSFREVSRHWVFELGVPVPRFRIEQFRRSHGLTFYSDGSDPSAVEAEELVPLYMQRALSPCNLPIFSGVEHILSDH